MSVSQYLARLKDIIRREGLSSLWFRALAVIGYKRAAFLEYFLERVKRPVRVDCVDEIRILDSDDAQSYIEFRRGATQHDFLKRLDAGKSCLAAFVGPRIASVSWIATETATLWLLNGDFELRPREAYIYDSFTHPDYRGKRIQSQIFAEVCESLLSKGFTSTVTFIVPENKPNFRSRNRQGFERTGMVRKFRFGPWARFTSTGNAPQMQRHR